MKLTIGPLRFRLPNLPGFPKATLPRIMIPLPNIRAKVPGIKAVVLPKNPVLATFLAVTVGVGITAIAVYFAVQGVNKPPQWPGAGVYVGERTVGEDPPRDLPGSLDYTFPSRTNRFSLEGIEVGKDGLTNVFEISTPSTSDYIYVSVMTADGIVCPRFILSTSDIANAIYINNRADGQAFTTIGGTPDDIQVGVRGARNRSAKNESYDKIILRGNGSGAQINELVLKNIRGFGGACDFSNLKIGTLYVTNSVVGTGDGINVNDFGFGQSVTIGTFTGDRNVETEIRVR